jgi:hypothetical protein
MRPQRPTSKGVDEVTDQIEQLMDDLQALVDAGLVIEVRELDQPSLYALSNPGRALATRSGGPDGHVHPIEDWPEPCPACDAREGFS